MTKLKTDSRTIRNTGQLRNIGLIPLAKATRACAYESGIERDGLYDLAYRTDVRSITAQPVTMDLWVDGRKTRYTPDVCYTDDAGEIHYREFKSDDFVADDKFRSVLAAAGEHLSARGYSFTVTKASEFRTGFRMDNIRCLHRYATWPISAATASKVFTYLETHTQSTLGDLRAALEGDELGGLYRMLYEQSVGVDIVSARLGSETLVWRKL